MTKLSDLRTLRRLLDTDTKVRIALSSVMAGNIDDAQALHILRRLSGDDLMVVMDWLLGDWVLDHAGAIASDGPLLDRVLSRWVLRLVDVAGTVDAILSADDVTVLTPRNWPGMTDVLGDDPTLGSVLCLYTRGNASLLSRLIPSRRIAVTGTRSSTKYGDTVAGNVAQGLARKGHIIVSGGSFGVDVASLHGALVVNDARTVLVSPTGINTVWSWRHADLFNQVVESGLVVSANPLGNVSNRDQFVVQRRLMGVLSNASVIVEGALQSLTSQVVDAARYAGHPVGAMPGPVTSTCSELPHELIRTHRAELVTCADDVIRLIGNTQGAGV